jgi:two-component system chemotaxis sensor kinase CheA
MSLQQLRQLFALESQDTLQQMEDALLHLESNPTDREAINVLFRTAHTIKGSAGVVGLDEISKFTHHMENVLEKVRGGQMTVTPEFVRFMLACRDHVDKMLEQATEHPDTPDPQLAEIREGLVAQLRAYLNPAQSQAEAKNDKPQATAQTPEPSVQASREAQLQRIYLQEVSQTLSQVEDAAHTLDKQPQDPQPLEFLYRAFHTLKGSSGLVGFQPMAVFAGTLEEELENCRKNQGFTVNQGFTEILRECRAHMENLLKAFGEQRREISPALEREGQTLLAWLRECGKHSATPAATPDSASSLPTQAPAKTPDEAVSIIDEPLSGDANWHISLRFHQDALRNGVDPLATLRYLKSAGRIVSIHTLFDHMPPAEAMDPENCYLGFEIAFDSQANKAQIEGLFDLMREHCDVRIVPPHSQLSHYIELIQSLPEDPKRLGEILIQSGTLTARELQDSLNTQSVRRQAEKEETGQAENNRIGEILVNTGAVQPELVEAALRKQKQMQDSKSQQQKTLQVDAEKLDQLINLVGELVIANASITLLMQEVSNDRLKEAVSLVSRLVEEIRNSTLRMRMVHIGGTFNRFRRLVHDISRDLGKQIDLVISGAETELDKSMVEKINDPLMHLVRNAIDHGIEPEAVRVAAGKAAAGTVQLNAYHDSGGIVIEVSDDGAGLNRKRIREAAVAKGIIKPDQELSDQEIDQLIFEPALSTAKEVTELSGRGVGLDVVKRNIGTLNGAIDIKTTPGEGTTMQLFLPLTLAIIDGFLLSVGDSSFVVPLDRVVECVEFTQNRQHAMQAGYLNLRGKVLPLLSLRQLFGMPQSAENARENIVVVSYGNQEAGLVVDQLLGEFQAVIKPLGKLFEKLPGVSGATILGSGEVALILDVPALVRKYTKQENKRQSKRKTAAPSASPKAELAAAV